MGIEGLSDVIVIPVVLICFMIGYEIKNHTKIPNDKIPLCMVIIGIITNIVITHDNNESITLTSIIYGAFSGLASTGSYELIVNMFKLKENKNKTSQIELRNIETDDSEKYESDDELK